MIVRNYAGGVVFSGDKVLLEKNEKDKWMLPRGKISDGELSNEVVKKKVEEESGVSAEFVSTAGHTNYEYCPDSRQNPFCNKTTWYIMKSQKENENFFKVDEAMKLIEENQEKSLINLSFKKYTGKDSMFNSLYGE
ncbi:NUDIX domain-containing protein [Herbivorax sp. ANBcel31]|uniref:NUDIX domain-containing protein n=1 Tax=Herbivorax sp. ANBcel31 TaxID=3069754 RepID=UPI0027B40CD6|nr:NUDIX domain-containing protein [Herbivorax sp. ANBcel31]MDQ2086348.1 NUDIX domain-containing protein [Herbivorax sp. ANBcel31]